MDDIQLALVLLGAFWAGTSSVFTGIKLNGDIQDRIIAGKVDGHELPKKYLRHLLVFHWLPLKLGLGIISLILGIIIVSLPSLRENAPSPDRFQTICYLAAALPFVGFLYQLAGAVFDGLLLYRYLLRK